MMEIVYLNCCSYTSFCEVVFDRLILILCVSSLFGGERLFFALLYTNSGNGIVVLLLN